jgi:hypothetical protein
MEHCQMGRYEHRGRAPQARRYEASRAQPRAHHGGAGALPERLIEFLPWGAPWPSVMLPEQLAVVNAKGQEAGSAVGRIPVREDLRPRRARS